MNKDELDGLITLKLVAEHRSFRKVAEELGISPAAASKIIKQVEHRLGVALLSRTTRSTSLTEAGENFLRQAGPGIEQIQAAIRGVGNYAEKVSGVLRINLPKTTFRPYLAPILKSFSNKYPDVMVDLFFEDQTSDVVESGFDAGIRLSEILAIDMIAVRLSGPIRFVVVGSKKYLEKAGRPKVPKDLLSHNCILFRFDPTSVYDRWEFEHKGRDLQVHVKGTLMMNDPILSIDAALDGLGLIYTVEDSVRDHLKSGRLEEVLAPFAPVSAGYYLYYPQRSQAQPKLRAFVQHIQMRLSR
jgi:DNA-binding transcriptional LysR family regulator